MKTLKIFLILSMVFAFIGCPSPDPDSSCLNEDNLAKDTTCLAATVLVIGNPFPNPVQSGGTLKIKMKIGAVGSQLNSISAIISTKVFNLNGQLVTQQNAGTVQSGGTPQDVPIWKNINVASGTYYLEVTVNVRACGSKKICLSDKRIVVIK